MGDLIVKPSYVFSDHDILDAAKLNLLATPIVELALEDPVNDQNFMRNGNYYSAFWTTPAGVSCPVNVWTTNANYWLVRPQGAAVTFLRSSVVPDAYSLFSAQITGAASVTTCEMGQQINGDLSATLRRKCTFSGYIYNSTGLTLSPILNIYTCNAFNNFSAVTLVHTVNLQTVAPSVWVLTSVTIDLSDSVTYPNVANGLLLAIGLPSGAINTTGKNVLFSRLKFQIGEVSTPFVDDVSLFVTSPTIDSTMLQDGCLARSTLYVTTPGVIPKGAYAANSIQSTDIGPGQVQAADLDPGVSTTVSAGFTVPAINAGVPITMTTTGGIVAGLVLNIAGAGAYSVTSIAGNVVTAINTGASGNAAPGTVVNTGAVVTTTIVASTTTTANFTTPAVQANVAITLSSVAGIFCGLSLNIQGAGLYSALSVSGSVCTAINTGATGNVASGTVIASGATVTITGNAVVNGLGYAPINKAGDPNLAGQFIDTLDTVINTVTPANSAILIRGTSANSGNDGYMPSLGFQRYGHNSRAIGLDSTGKFKTVDNGGNVGYLLDTITKVDTNSYQDASITLAKLATSLVNLLIAPGIMHAFAGPSPPSGWLVCDGTQYLQSTYPALYAAIGSYYGAGGSGASAWFQVPDLRGRMPIGYVNTAVGGITARTFGSKAGTETHLLTVAEMPVHNHTATDSHTHVFHSLHQHSYINPTGSTNAAVGSGAYSAAGGTNTSTPLGTADYMDNASGFTTIANAGGSGGTTQAHDQMQPCIVMYWIIKT